MSFIFSLTSYPDRFDYLPHVIDSLKRQTIKADSIVLNIAKEDKKFLKLNSYKEIDINFVEDLKAMKKLLPTLVSHPSDNIVTVDDDVIYPNHLSESLLIGHQENSDAVITGRAREIQRDGGGEFKPYMKWPLYFDGHQRATNLIPTGVGGVFYPKNTFHNDVFDETKYQNFITVDDFWWYTQARRANAEFVQVPIFKKKDFPNIFPIANRGLFYYGNKTKNDEAFSKLISLYGNFTGI